MTARTAWLAVAMVVIVVPADGWGATVKWSAASAGSFETAANWSTGTVPGTTDDVYFDGTSNTDCTISASHTVKSIHQFTYSGVVTFGSGTTFSTTDTTTFSVVASGGWVINGTVSLSNNNQTAFNGGAITINGTLTSLAPLFTVNTSMGGTGGMFRVFGDVSWGSPLYTSTGTWTLSMEGSGNQNLFMWSGNNLNGLSIAGMSTTILTNGPPQASYVKVNGDVTVGAFAKLDMSVGNPTLALTGSLQVGNSAGLHVSPSATVAFIGAGTQNLTTSGATLPAVAISGGGTVTLLDAAPINGQLDVSNGVLSAGTRNLTILGNWHIGAAGGFAASTGETVTFSSSAQSIAVDPAAAASFHNLTYNGPGTLTVTGPAFTVLEMLSVSGGASTRTIDLDTPAATIYAATVTSMGRVTWARAGAALTLGDTNVMTGGQMVMTAPGGHLTFTAGKTLHVFSGGSVNLTGASAAPILLRSSVAAMAWNLVDDSAPSATVASLIGTGPSGSNPTYVDVMDSTASGTAAPIRPGGSIDSGRNVNWMFGAPPSLPDAGVLGRDGGGAGLNDPTSPYACATAPGAHTRLPVVIALTLLAAAARRRLGARKPRR